LKAKITQKTAIFSGLDRLVILYVARSVLPSVIGRADSLVAGQKPIKKNPGNLPGFSYS
jgi:hypothetical protein